jgi:nicotinamide-nucleotide adenylyltransferase
MNDRKTALVIGRFQPMHFGHLLAIKEILGMHAKLILVIGSSQESRTKKNPFSAKERKAMISGCLKEEGLLGRTAIYLLPDQNNHPKWVEKVLGIAKKAQVVYSGNWLVQSLLKPKYEVHTMKSDVKISATDIRGMISRGDPKWKKYVPKTICAYLEKNKLLNTIK